MWNQGAGLISCRARLPLQGVLTGWKNGNPKKPSTYAAQRREGKWWGSHSCLKLSTEEVQRHSHARFLSQVHEERMRGCRYQLQQGKLWPNILKKKKSQFSNKSDHTMGKEPVKLQISIITISALITALLIRLCVGTTTCSRQRRRRRMKLKPWHMSWVYQRKVNITVMKAMLLWNLQLCSSGACQHHEFVDVDFSSGQSAFIGKPVLIAIITLP